MVSAPLLITWVSWDTAVKSLTMNYYSVSISKVKPNLVSCYVEVNNTMT